MKWVKLAQEGQAPIARSSHSITAVGNSIFLLGGENVSRTPVGSAVYKYDCDVNSWSLVEASGTPPPPRVAHTAAAVGPLLYIFGGRSGIDMGEGALNDLHLFDTSLNEWRPVEAQGSAPPARSFHTMAAVGDKLYVFGGCGEKGRLNDLYCFDTTTNTWQELPNSTHIAPRGGAWLSTCEGAHKLCVVGGFCGKELNDLHEFDLESNQWDCPGCCQTKTTLPARSVFGGCLHSCANESCTLNSGLVAFGGEVDPSDLGHSGAGNFSRDVFAYSAKEGWKKLEPEGEGPCARGWFASATTADGNLVVHGGLNDANDRLDDMFMLQMH